MGNPVLSFYLAFMQFLMNREYDADRASLLIRMQKENKNMISLPDLDEEELKLLHASSLPRRVTRASTIRFEEIGQHCFQDMAGQFRTKIAREVFSYWYRSDETLIHIRRAVRLGDGLVAVTIVTNDDWWSKRQGLVSTEMVFGNYIRITQAKK